MQRIRTRTIFILLVMVNLTISFTAAKSLAETPVIGFVAQDTTWTQANSPYVTLGHIIVKEGVTLTIKPGVTVQFDTGHSLTIEGTLIARGTDKQGIKFTPKGEQKPGAWDGIAFEDSSTDAEFDDAGNYVSGPILQYCTVEFAKTAVKTNTSSPLIDHCVISNNANGGISISKGDIVVIQNSMIADNKGGGISVSESENTTLTGNSVMGNTAQHYKDGHKGGGIHVSSVIVTISNNAVTRNTARGDDHSFGGGIYVESSNAAINSNTITENTAQSHFSYGGGGGIYVEGNATISNNTITGNTVSTQSWGNTSSGGGIYIYSKGGNVTISNNIVIDNTAAGGSSDDGQGGGIYVSSNIATINDNTLTENVAKGGESYWDDGGSGYGGGIYVSSNIATINDNTLTENIAKGGESGWRDEGSGYGGGIYVPNGTVSISDNILTANTADYGGGIYVPNGTVSISDNIVNGNTAGYGGGIYTTSSATITGNNLTENRSSNGAAIYYTGSQNITDNFIANNVAEGGGNTNAVYIDGNPTFTGNTIIGNQTKYNLYYDASKDSPNLNATNNYWGVTTEVEIRGKIHDFFADMSKAIVDVVPFLVEKPLPLGSLTVASFTYSPESPSVGDEITFDASNSNAPDGEIVSYQWDLGDGNTASGEKVTHSYDTPYTYIITLTVTDDGGDKAEQTIGLPTPLIGGGSFIISYSGSPTLEIANLDKGDREQLYNVIKQVLNIGKAKSKLIGEQDETLLSDVNLLLNQLHPDKQDKELAVKDVVKENALSEGQELFVGFAGGIAGAGVTFLTGIPAPFGLGEVAKLFGLKLGEWMVLKDMGSATVEYPSVGRMEIVWRRPPEDKIFVNIYLNKPAKRGCMIISVGEWQNELKMDWDVNAHSTVPVWNAFAYPPENTLTDPESIIDHVQIVSLHSPSELRVYDSQGRVTGLVNGEIREEIPGSVYDDERKEAIIFSPSDSYRYEIVGTDEGKYELEVREVAGGEATTFTATDIPTSLAAVHQYAIDWDVLSKGEKGVTVQMDSDGDGTFEETLYTGATFIASEEEHPWDINSDGTVDIFDLIIVGKHLGESPPTHPGADVNKDGAVDISDLVLVGKHFGESYFLATSKNSIE